MKKVVVVGPHFSAQGGMATVLDIYRQEGLFDQQSVLFLPTHIDGSKWKKFRLAIATFFTFLILLMFRQVSMLHAHVATRASFWRKALFMLLARLFGTPYIFHLHSGLFQGFYERCGVFGKWLTRYLLRNAKYVFVLSSDARQWIVSIVPEASVTIFSNPIRMLPYVRENRHTSHVLFMGKLDSNKGIYDLLPAIEKLTAFHPGLRLSIAGEGEIEQVRALVTQLGLEKHVDLLGWVVGDQKAQLLSTATVFVLPSYREGMPMGVLEAMSVGLPVVASQVGAVPDMLQAGLEGEVIPAGNIDALAGALNRLLSDAAYRESCALHARDRVERNYAAGAVLQRLKVSYYS
ncbi:glycosyltransferase family 4 protein [Chitinivorax sp. B]|uniref:glycosyltransferase family 4 protein n=1 Tax=Chitinivorax sp. B TaxID=2502235 RepID=UPI0010F52471|nr:glycosyltransferase family 4 protein [Chitinivorax sp. B]